MRELRTSGVVAVLLCLSGLAGCSRQAVVADSPAAQPTGTALLTSDLNRLNAQQADYKTDHGRYAESLGTLGYSPSKDVNVSVIQGDDRGYSAIASDGKNECAIYVGQVRAPRGYVNGPNAVFCRS